MSECSQILKSGGLSKSLHTMDVRSQQELLTYSKVFHYDGYTCMVRRLSFSNTVAEMIKKTQTENMPLEANMIWFTGYIWINANTVGGQLPTDELDDVLQLHGGITYDESDCGMRKVGFDCNHAGDGTRIVDYMNINDHIWNEKQVKTEIKLACLRLAKYERDHKNELQTNSK